RPKRIEPLSDDAPREIRGANAPLSAAGSAAQQARVDEDHSGPVMESAEADRIRPRFHVVTGAHDDYKEAVGASDHGDEEGDEDWPEDLPEDSPEDSLDSASEVESRMEARVEGGGLKAPFLAVVENSDGESRSQSAPPEPQSPIPNPRSGNRS